MRHYLMNGMDFNISKIKIVKTERKRQVCIFGKSVCIRCPS